jgi:hypothetical protein
MRTEPSFPRRSTATLVWLLVTLSVTGCAHRQPPPEQTESWYRKESLFDAFDADAGGLSLPNAYLLELACYIGDRGTFEVDRTLSMWGFAQRRDFRDLRTSTYGYVASNDSVVLVTFGGTDFLNVRDLLSDVDALQLVHDPRYCATPDARVHRGFRDSLNSVIDGVISEVKRQAQTSAEPAAAPASALTTTTTTTTTSPATQADPPASRPRGKTLFVAGHSRGGAFAVLAAAAFAREAAQDSRMPPTGGVYTFGQPRVGNGPFVEGVEAVRVPLYRFIQGDDPIPAVPPAGLVPQQVRAADRLNDRLGYRHGGIAVHLRKDARVVQPSADDAGGSNVLTDARAAAAAIGDHYQDKYHSAIYRALADPQLVQEPTWRATVSPTTVGALPRP